MRLERIELLIALLGLLSALLWGLSSATSAVWAAAGATAGLASFVTTKAMVLALVCNGTKPARALLWTALKWALVVGASAGVLRCRLEVDALALATGVSCLPAAVLAEALLWTLSGRIDGARIQLGG